MKKAILRTGAILVPAVFFLLLALITAYGGKSGVDGYKVYYDGTITITAKGTTGDGSTFNESTTITGFKIEHWNVIPGMIWQGDSFSCTANVTLSDYSSEGKVIAKFGPEQFHFTARQGGSVPDVASLMIQKTDKGFKYSLQACPPELPGGNPRPFWWAGPGETLGGDYLPLEISGKLTKSDDGVTTTMTWVLNRHIKP